MLLLGGLGRRCVLAGASTCREAGAAVGWPAAPSNRACARQHGPAAGTSLQSHWRLGCAGEPQEVASGAGSQMERVGRTLQGSRNALAVGGRRLKAPA